MRQQRSFLRPTSTSDYNQNRYGEGVAQRVFSVGEVLPAMLTVCLQWMFLLQVVFFQQGSLPCLSREGRVIMESPFKVLDVALLQWEAQ